ncbi:MAG: ABC transporter substrate-binding protein [Hyphomicrobiaceae bacterium]
MLRHKSLKSGLTATGVALSLAISAPASAQVSDDVVKIGVLNDQSSLYADLNGPGGVVAAKMAIEDFGGTVLGKKIEIIAGDVQNKPDIAVSISGRWFDTENVDMVIGGGGSASSLATSRVAADKNKLYLAIDPATSDLTGKACTATTIHWVYDTIALANGTGSAVVKAGGKTWFFLTADYAFGHSLERDVSAVVKANGGQVLGHVLHPLNTSDFSSFLLQAQSSGAKIIGLANAGGDTVNSIKQASEFGITQGGQSLAGLLVFIMDVHSIGLKLSQGLKLTSAFYWDHDEGTRAFSKRFAKQMNGRMPTSLQAGYYSAVLDYLKAIKATGTDDTAKVVAWMKANPTDDPLFGKGYIRKDGRKMHTMYLYEVKKPEESKYAWDYYKLVREIPAEEAFRPMDKGGCPLVK